MANPAHRNDASPKGRRKAAPAPVAPERALRKPGLIEKLASAADEAETSHRLDLSGLSRAERSKLLFGK